jgi:hypothetical protein
MREVDDLRARGEEPKAAKASMTWRVLFEDDITHWDSSGSFRELVTRSRKAGARQLYVWFPTSRTYREFRVPTARDRRTGGWLDGTEDDVTNG